MRIEYLKDLIQSCNINFLIGSGFSCPYLSTLGNIETMLTQLEKEKPSNEIFDLIKASLYKKYCEGVIFKNLSSEIEEYKKLHQEEAIDEGENVIDKYQEYETILESYRNFLLSINEILLFRHNNLLTKQVNLFTTNIDLFLEKALEGTNLEYNDGFKGRINPIYNLGNFQKIYSKTSSHYDNISEIPVFNLLKIHGSLNWQIDDSNQIIFNRNLTHIRTAKYHLDKISTDKFINISDEDSYRNILRKAQKLRNIDSKNYLEFFEKYNKLIIINPTKAKFERTLFDEEFYELLRIYANSLEKENTILFVMGFSFSDEHIKNITIRAANSNPTLQVIIFVYKDDELEELSRRFRRIKNNNVQFLTPEAFIKANQETDEKKHIKQPALKVRLQNFNCESINQEIFVQVKGMVRLNK